MTNPTDTKVLEENSNIQPNEENTENIVEESSGGVQPMASQVSLLYRAPAVLIDDRTVNISEGGENILFKYEGQTVFDGWYFPGNNREWDLVNKWWCPNSTLKYFQLYKDYNTNKSSNNIIFGNGGEWSNSGPTETADSVSLGDNFQLTTDDEGWGIKWDEGIAIKNCFDTYNSISTGVENERYDLCGFILFNGTNLSGWNEINAQDYDADINFVLYVKADDDSGLSFRGMSTDFSKYANFDRVYIAPVYKFVSSSSDTKINVHFLQGQGIIINSFPDFESKQYPELVKGLYSETVGDSSDLSFYGKSIDFGAYEEEPVSPVSLPAKNKQDITSHSFEVPAETNFNAEITNFNNDYKRTSIGNNIYYNFLGYVLTAMNIPGNEVSTYNNPLSWFAPYDKENTIIDSINYSSIDDLAENNPYNYIRAVWLLGEIVKLTAHCPVDDDGKEYTYEWQSDVAINSDYPHLLNVKEGNIRYSNPPFGINFDKNSTPSNITLTLNKISAEGMDIGEWQLWDAQEGYINTFKNNSVEITKDVLNSNSELFVVPIINSIITTDIDYTNNTAWDFTLEGSSQQYGTISRWTKGTISVREEDKGDLYLVAEGQRISTSSMSSNNSLYIGLDHGYDDLFMCLMDVCSPSFIQVLQPSGADLFTVEFSGTPLKWSDKLTSDPYEIKCSNTDSLLYEENWSSVKKLVVEGKLDETVTILDSWNLNVIIKSTKFTYDKHSIGTSGEESRTLTEVKQKLNEGATIEYADSTYVIENNKPTTRTNTYSGNGAYQFIVASELDLEDNVIFDYQQYLCGTLLGYITSKEDDLNTLISNDSSFFLGFVQPAEAIMTVYGFDTMQSEKYLIEDFNNPSFEKSADTGDDPASGYILNWGYGGKDVYNYVTSDDYVMPNDNSTLQTGNQYIVFRLRNPYDGKVLNYDETASYGSKNTSIATYESQEEGVTTHEQITFLTIWEQRSIFNALNGKPTFVNECHDYKNDITLKKLVELTDEETQEKGIFDKHGTFTDSEGQEDKYDMNAEFSILRRNPRKAGRALVDNIDDWFNWYKREESPGFYANSETTQIPGGSPLMFVAPILNEDYGCCIQSDATQSNKVLGPGESITVPIIVLYKTYEEEGRDSTKYTIGFDIRNSLYLDPIYYQFTLNAKYSSSILDSVSSQKASTLTSTKYNVTVR